MVSDGEMSIKRCHVLQAGYECEQKTVICVTVFCGFFSDYDYFHWTEQGEWKFDPKYLPDPDKMCRELREMGIESVVSIRPTINPGSEKPALCSKRMERRYPIHF